MTGSCLYMACPLATDLGHGSQEQRRHRPSRPESWDVGHDSGPQSDSLTYLPSPGFQPCSPQFIPIVTCSLLDTVPVPTLWRKTRVEAKWRQGQLGSCFLPGSPSSERPQGAHEACVSPWPVSSASQADLCGDTGKLLGAWHYLAVLPSGEALEKSAWRCPKRGSLCLA